jgi:hypothetical protein
MKCWPSDIIAVVAIKRVLNFPCKQFEDLNFLAIDWVALFKIISGVWA